MVNTQHAKYSFIMPFFNRWELTLQRLNEFRKFMRLATKLVLFLIVPYCLLVSLYSEWFLQVFYGGKYKSYGIIVVLIAVRYAANTLAEMNIIALRVLHRPKNVFFAYLASAILTIVISIPLVKFTGITGGAAGISISYMTLFIIAAYFAKKFSKNTFTTGVIS